MQTTYFQSYKHLKSIDLDRMTNRMTRQVLRAALGACPKMYMYIHFLLHIHVQYSEYISFGKICSGKFFLPKVKIYQGLFYFHSLSTPGHLWQPETLE